MNRKGKHEFRLALLAALLGMLYTPSAAVAGVQSIQQRIDACNRSITEESD